MNELTKEQKQWLWEQCGFKKNTSPPLNYWSNREDYYSMGLPSTDLNNLFKYAVPKVKECYGGEALYKLLKQWVVELALSSEPKDPALALSSAIYKALEEKSKLCQQKK